MPALIAQPGQLRTSLLGMSFLNRLESWEVRGDKLIMRGYPLTPRYSKLDRRNRTATASRNSAEGDFEPPLRQPVREPRAERRA